MGIPDHLICLLRNLCAGQEATVRTGMEQQTGSKQEKEHVKAIYCHLAYLTSIQSTSCEMVAGWIASWNQDRWEKYQQLQICRWCHPNGWKWRGTKETLDEGERGEWKIWLKTQLSKKEDHGIHSHHFWQIIGKKTETVTDFILGFQNHRGWWL